MNHKSSQEEDKSDANYGAWILVTRKRNPARVGQGRGPNLNEGKLEKGILGNSEQLNGEVGPSINIKAVDASRENKVVISNGKREGDKPKEVVSHTQNVSAN